MKIRVSLIFIQISFISAIGINNSWVAKSPSKQQKLLISQGEFHMLMPGGKTNIILVWRVESFANDTTVFGKFSTYWTTPDCLEQWVEGEYGFD